MKFKEQRGNVFVFDGGYAGGELELHYSSECGRVNEFYMYEEVVIQRDFRITTDGSSYQDIQTAVKLMQILIDEGLV